MTKPAQNINIGGIEKGSYKRINESLKIAKLVNYDKQFGLLRMKTPSTNEKKNRFTSATTTQILYLVWC